MDTANTVVMPVPSEYGAAELKAFIKKHTYKAFIITVSLFILLLLFYSLFNKITSETARVKMAPVVKLTLQQLQQLDQAQDVPPPPTQQLNTGPAVRAGTPVPVPDTKISEDLKDFADIKDLSRASSVGGDGVDLGGMASNIDIDRDTKVNVQVQEEEPGLYDFVNVEEEPSIDLNELQKKIEYPEMARRANIEGKVIIRVLVGKNGLPKKTVVESSDNELLNEAARKAVNKSKFKPAIQNKTPIDCWVSIPISFRIR